MQPLMLIFHMIIAFILIILILLQHCKGADMGASFGSGASQTMFGSSGSLPFLIKVTAILAAIFFATSVTLSYLASPHAQQNAQIAPSPIAPASTVPINTGNQPA